MKLTNPDKVLYPATGTTKGEVFDYYVSIAEAMIPHIAGRAVTRKRWPNGVDEPAFFEKQLASSAPDWLDRESVTHRSGTTTYPIIDSVDGLAWIGQQAALEVHVPQWRFVDGQSPDPRPRLVFDLDPGEGVTMPQLCEVASAVRELMSDIGLTTYPLTSGSKGLHLYAPLADPVSSRGASVLAKRVAQQLEKAMPKLVTSTMTKSLRAGKVFLDWSQNNGSKTTIAPYSLRGREHPRSPRRAPGTRSRTPNCGICASTRCSSVSPSTVTCSRRSTSRCPRPTGSRRTAACAMRRKRLSRCRSRSPKPATTTRSSSRSTTRDGCTTTSGSSGTACWCRGRCPRTCPDTPAVNHLAVHTEDHPLEYLTFEATIPKGEYGGGKMIIWDTGTYETEKFNDNAPDGPAKGGEVIVTLHGEQDRRPVRADPDRRQELAGAPDEGAEAAHCRRSRADAVHGGLGGEAQERRSGHSRASGTATGCWWTPTTASSTLRSRRGRDVTGEYPQFEALAADLADHHVILDGEAVALDESGVPSFGEMQNRARSTRVEFWAFDILHLDGRSLLRAKYSDRRRYWRRWPTAGV